MVSSRRKCHAGWWAPRLQCSSDIDLTGIHASHHDNSVACHVPAIQKNVHLSACNLSCSRPRDCSPQHNCKQFYIRGWASIVDERLGGYMELTTRLLLPEEQILSGLHLCVDEGGHPLLMAEIWMLGTVWEVLALCLAVWIVVKHFCEIHRSSTGWVVENFFAVLIKTHVLYFVAWVRNLTDYLFRWGSTDMLLLLAQPSAFSLRNSRWCDNNNLHSTNLNHSYRAHLLSELAFIVVSLKLPQAYRCLC